MGNPHLVDEQIHASRVEAPHARVADRGEDAPEVWIGGEEGGFHEGRMRDRVGDAATFGGIAATLDLEGDELRRALAVSYDGLRQVARDVTDRHLELQEVATARGRGPEPRRREDQRVVGRGIAVDRHAVEGALDDALEQALQCAPWYLRVRRHEAEHRCHVGPDHAGALGDTSDHCRAAR